MPRRMLTEQSCSCQFSEPGSHRVFSLDVLVPQKRDIVRLVGNCWWQIELFNIVPTLSKVVISSNPPTANRLHTFVPSLTVTIREKLDTWTISLISRRTFVTSRASVAHASLRPQISAITSLILDLPAAAVAPVRNKICKEAAQSSSLQCHQVPLATNAATILGGISTGLLRRVVSSTYWCLVWYTTWTFTSRYRNQSTTSGWPFMNRNVCTWAEH